MFVGMPMFFCCTHFGYAFKYHALLVSARRVPYGIERGCATCQP